MRTMMKMNPKWKHDCDKCKYLGTTYMNAKVMDWYTCGTAPQQSVIARQGNDGPEYWSVPTEVLGYGDTVRTLEDTLVFNGMNLLAEVMLNKGPR
jgi:hypothetical protein